VRLYWGLLPFLFGLAACNPELSTIDTASSSPTASKVTDATKTVKQPDDTSSTNTNVLFLEFTIEGKQTKTIETPWGAREVYDIRQDPNVKSAIDFFYDQKGSTFDDISGHLTAILYPDENPELSYLLNANLVTSLDLARLGCESIIRPICRERPTPRLFQPTGGAYLGSPYRSSDEIEKYPMKGWNTMGPLNVHSVLEGNEDKLSWYLPVEKQKIINGEVRKVVGQLAVGMCKINPETNMPLEQKSIIPSGKYFIGEVSGFTKEQTWDISTCLLFPSKRTLASVLFGAILSHLDKRLKVISRHLPSLNSCYYRTLN